MTQNLYLGADLTPLFTATGTALTVRAGQIWAHVQQVDFPARARALARLVAQQKPELLGLQEVALWQKLQARENGPPQVVQTVDFLKILTDALAAAGVSYRSAAVDQQFTSVRFPLPITLDRRTTTTFTDRDAILVRDDLPASQLSESNPQSRSFEAHLQVPAPGGDGRMLSIPRGWSTVDVRAGGRSFRFANTHLEAYSPPGKCANGQPSRQPAYIRNIQAGQLAAELRSSPLPVVLVGDLNAPPNEVCDALPIFRSAGFTDDWATAMPGVPAATAGQTDDLNNVPSRLNHQVDYVLSGRPGVLDPVAGSGAVVGGRLADRTPSGLWPSDHAGMALTIRLTHP